MTSNVVTEFQGEYRFLSNFWSCFIEYELLTYPSVENAYQAAKCADKSDRLFFLTAKSSEAKRRGKVVKIRSDWDKVRLGVMLGLLRQKFSQEPLKSKLLATGNKILQEGNWWGDKFWGVSNGEGENNLGKLLMQVRGELQK